MRMFLFCLFLFCSVHYFDSLLHISRVIFVPSCRRCPFLLRFYLFLFIYYASTVACFVLTFIIIILPRFLLVEGGIIKHLVAALLLFIDRSNYSYEDRDDNSMTALCLAIGRSVSHFFFF